MLVKNKMVNINVRCDECVKVFKKFIKVINGIIVISK